MPLCLSYYFLVPFKRRQSVDANLCTCVFEFSSLGRKILLFDSENLVSVTISNFGDQTSGKRPDKRNENSKEASFNTWLISRTISKAPSWILYFKRENRDGKSFECLLLLCSYIPEFHPKCSVREETWKPQ